MAIIVWVGTLMASYAGFQLAPADLKNGNRLFTYSLGEDDKKIGQLVNEAKMIDQQTSRALAGQECTAYAS